MNSDIRERQWNRFSGNTKDRWGKLTNDRLDVLAAKRDRLEGEIQQAYGIVRDAAEKQVKAYAEISKR